MVTHALVGTELTQAEFEATATIHIGSTYDAVVASSGQTYTTLQDADDALTPPYSLWVKQATYAAGLTVNTNGAFIYLEPGTVVEAAITLSGNNITLMLGAGCDIQGLITLSGDDCSLIGQNECTLVGIEVTGDRAFVDGGGWGTVVDGGTSQNAIRLTGSVDTIVKNLTVQTTADQDNAYAGLRCGSTSTRFTFENIKVVDSDSYAIYLSSSCTDGQIKGCTILAADQDGIFIEAPRTRAHDNKVTVDGSLNGIYISDAGDNSAVNSNMVQVVSGNPIEIHALGEDCVATGNRTDGAIVDNSGTSTVASNEETAF